MHLTKSRLKHGIINEFSGTYIFFIFAAELYDVLLNKTHTYFSSLIFSVLLIFIVSCEQEVKLELPDESSQRVMNCIINPDSLISITLSNSHLVSDTTVFNLRLYDTVVIKENDIKIDTIIGSANGVYKSKFKPKEHRKYYIEASNKDIISGFDSLPAKGSIDSFYIKKINGFNYYFRLVFEKPDLSTHYFILRILQKTSDSTFKPIVYTIFNNIGGIEMPENGLIFKDDQFNSRHLEFDLSVYTSKKGFLFVEIQNISKSLYTYYLTLIQNYNANTGSGFQRVKMFNNIENGIGIIGACTISRDSVEIK
jgi:hypothetical protein